MTMGQAKDTKFTKESKDSLLFQKIRIIAQLRKENRELKKKIAMLESNSALGAEEKHKFLLNEKTSN